MTSSITEVKHLTQERIGEIKLELLKVVKMTIHDYVMNKRI